MGVKKIVVIPTYNEVENIGLMIEAVMGLEEEFDVLVVDDSSPDGTGEAVREKMKKWGDRVFLEVRGNKNGLGRAYIHGFGWALDKGYDYICEMDADFSHNPQDLPRLYRQCADGGADVAVGSRYVKGVNVVNWPLRRILLSKCASIYVKVVTGMKVEDPTAGFVCYRRQVLEGIGLKNVHFVGYAFQVEMKYKAHVHGFKIVEVPIIFIDRVRGKSKMNASIIKEAVFGVLKLAIRRGS